MSPSIFSSFFTKLLHQKISNKKYNGVCSCIVRKSIKLTVPPPVMSQEFFNNYLIVNISDSKGFEFTMVKPGSNLCGLTPQVF